MVDGTYGIMLKTPLGVKKGGLILKTNSGALNGSMEVKGKDNPFTGGSVDGNNFKFSGELMSSIGKLNYECTGFVEGEALTATATSKKGTIQITGMRKAH